MKKVDLSEKIKRRLGFPMVKVELDPTQIYDAIDYAKSKFVKWAIGQATQETFFTVMLSAGQNFYDLPVGVTEVINYDEGGGYGGGINHLFTVDNFLYNQGMFNALTNTTTGNSYSLISYHIARDFLETLKRYTPTMYNYKYHRYTNQLEIHPAPPSGSSFEVYDQNNNLVDSPGYILLYTHMIEGSSIDGWASGDSDESFYGLDWIFDYSLAECKIMLGRIRTKFAQFNSIGNTGISLDGDSLISEGIEEKRELKETLMLEENFEGYPILIG